jgi:hypothetical protein
MDNDFLGAAITPLPFLAKASDRRDSTTLGLSARDRDPLMHAMKRVAIRKAQLRKATELLAQEISKLCDESADGAH